MMPRRGGAHNRKKWWFFQTLREMRGGGGVRVGKCTEQFAMMPSGVRSVADHLRGDYFEDILRVLSDALSRFIS